MKPSGVATMMVMKIKQVQEKCGFVYLHTIGLEVPILGETRTGHTNYLTRALAFITEAKRLINQKVHKIIYFLFSV